MTVQAKTSDIALVADTDAGTDAPTLQQSARQAVSPAALTCAWVRTGDGALVMQWTVRTTADAYEAMTRAAA